MARFIILKSIEKVLRVSCCKRLEMLKNLQFRVMLNKVTVFYNFILDSDRKLFQQVNDFHMLERYPNSALAFIDINEFNEAFKERKNCFIYLRKEIIQNGRRTEKKCIDCPA